ncbi:MAG TPA: glutamate-cysteine ligase family protein [Acidimicrobiia bacterium]|nr:glutamate-cysteine ligase family protein [Acidimicrobiia bacterium]
MPSPSRCITTRDIRRHVDEHVFADQGAQQVGIELEWVTNHAPGTTVPGPAELRPLVESSLPGASRLTFEPGGQLELSGPAHVGVGSAIGAMTADVASVRAALDPAGVTLRGIGLDPSGMRDRVVTEPRYAAMEAYFDTRWPRGRTMMRNTASVQVNLDLGGAALVDLRWQRAHDLTPVLAAAFANSPFDVDGTPTGWRSSRLAVWRGIDPRRTRPAARAGLSAATAWTTYALEAPVMLVRVGDACEVPSRPLPFARWIHDGHELGWPTLDDFEYHLTTLFPPVRPRGWLELRTIDMLPDEWWPVAVAIATALLDAPEAAEVVDREAPALRHRGADAERLAMSDPTIEAVVERCFAAALPALATVGADRATIEAAETYYERFIARGRCPADDLHADPTWLRAVT